LEALNAAYLVAGTLVFVSVLAGLYSARAGLSFLLVFLVAGMLAGEDGPGGIVFDDFRLAFWVGNAALAVILLDGGLRTHIETFRTGLKPALWLATAGVTVTAGVTGLAAAWLLELPPVLGLLVGSIVGSTDAAAVFALIKGSRLALNERVAATLEIESGLNDPMAVFLTLALIGWVMAPADRGVLEAVRMIGQQFAIGAAGGLLGGTVVAALLLRAPQAAEPAGITALLLLSSGVAVFAGSGWLGGSGFLAVYLFGIVVRYGAPARVQGALLGMDGYAWMAQACMFLLLGLLVTPSQLVPHLLPALSVAGVLMLVARPVAVALCLAPLRFPRNEIMFISWVGLRGAVPIVLAVFPLMAGVPGARLFFEVAFVVVLSSLALQGATIGWSARRCGVSLPELHDESAQREWFGDFVLDAQMPANAICSFYGLRIPGAADTTLGDWLAAALGRPPVVADAVDWDFARFSVRSMDGPRITRVGLQLRERPQDGEPIA
jgi:cell volume regulation protein A